MQKLRLVGSLDGSERARLSAPDRSARQRRDRRGSTGLGSFSVKSVRGQTGCCECYSRDGRVRCRTRGQNAPWGLSSGDTGSGHTGLSDLEAGPRRATADVAQTQKPDVSSADCRLLVLWEGDRRVRVCGRTEGVGGSLSALCETSVKRPDLKEAGRLEPRVGSRHGSWDAGPPGRRCTGGRPRAGPDSPDSSSATISSPSLTDRKEFRTRGPRGGRGWMNCRVRKTPSPSR